MPCCCLHCCKSFSSIIPFFLHLYLSGFVNANLLENNILFVYAGPGDAIACVLSP